MQNLFSFGGPAAELALALEEARPRVKAPGKDGKNASRELPLFAGDEPVRGAFKVSVTAGKKLDHTGVKIEMVGVIELPNERTPSYEFTSLSRELEPGPSTPGYCALEGDKVYPFDFSAVDKPHESYYGRTARLRYFIRATVSRAYASNLVKEQDLWVQTLSEPPPIDSSIKMEVGIEDCLHIEFEYEKSRYVALLL